MYWGSKFEPLFCYAAPIRKAEIARFTLNGNLVTLHSTGQAWISKPDGVLVAYREMPCRFGCMEEI